MGESVKEQAELERLGIDVIKALAMDAPAKANSGHQGTAMALAPLAHVLFTRVMRYDASAPHWPDRDRFVLSAGHASILQYSLLYLTGFGLTLDDIEQFRQWGSRTPGHPEVHHTTGVEVTTGPLGQGVANAVGMAMAEQNLRARFGADVCDHHIWCIAGDGDLSEGLSHEAASLAGHLRLDHLTVIYDDNHVSIDGPTELSLTDDPAKRFAAYGWNVLEVGEIAEDVDALEAALRQAKAHTGAPTIVILRSHIAFPSPTLTDSPSAHGLAFKPADIEATKSAMGLPPDQSFYVPDEVVEMYRAAGVAGAPAREAWEAALPAALGEHAAEWEARQAGVGLDGWTSALPTFEVGEQIATRVALAKTLTALVDVVPGLMSGGADLTGNTGTELKGQEALSPANPGGRQIHFGVREHAMGATMNGMALHGGVYPVGGTFLVFSDYMRPSVRLAALMGTKVLFAWSHDSVGVGEDGPTHQPVEHVAALRAIPDLDVMRPADANETAHAVRLSLEGTGPMALIMSRQNLPVLEGTSYEGVANGGYVLRDADGAAITLVATGSEVSLAVEAADALASKGIGARVVSLPSWERFEAAGRAYQAEVLPSDVPTLAIEAQVTFGWHRWADDVIGIDRFGASAPGDLVLAKLGINVDAVVARATALVNGTEN
ncbi:MAG: transketolase [Acidimicrobiales bacterium]